MEKKLNQLLASLCVLSMKSKNYHWNIFGKGFFSVHKTLDDVYDNLNNKVDEIAERLLALQVQPVSSYKTYLELSIVEEADNKKIKIEDAIQNLIQDYKQVLQLIKEVKVIADEQNDYGTSAMLDEYIIEFEKTLWMFRAYNGE